MKYTCTKISKKHQHYAFIFLLFTYTLVIPKISFASPLWYGNILNITDDTATIELRGLENKNYFTCSIKSLDCVALPVLPKTFPKATLTSSENKSLVSFPAKSSRQNISSSGRYGFYVIDSPSSKTITSGIIDGKLKKKYTVVNSLNFWNLLDQQPHISRFAQDDSTFAYLSDRSGFMSIYLSKLNPLTKTSFQGNKITSNVSVGDFMYADPQTILYIANSITDPYNWILYSYDISKKTKKILVQNLTYDSIIHMSGKSIVVTRLTPLGTMPVVIPDYTNNDLRDFNLPVTHPDTNTISYSYQKIAAMNTVFMKNTSSKTINHPLIIWLHGGPYRQTSFKRHAYISYGVYDWVLEEAVNKGDAYVLKIDYPGSYGSGKALTEKIKGGVGTTDVKSIINVINGFTQSHQNIGKIYVVGNSYGGYVASKLMTSYPSQINGGISINGVTDWKVLLLYYKNSIFNTFFSGAPNSTNKTLYSKASIINNIASILNPLYIIQAEKDSTIPKDQAIILKRALDDAHKESNLILIPDENHVFLKNSSINTICKALFEMINLDANNSCNLEG